MRLQHALLQLAFPCQRRSLPFKKIDGGYDLKDIGVNNEGAVKGLQAIVELINAGTMPKGASYNVMEQKMNNGELAMMVSGPWA